MTPGKEAGLPMSAMSLLFRNLQSKHAISQIHLFKSGFLKMGLGVQRLADLNLEANPTKDDAT